MDSASTLDLQLLFMVQGVLTLAKDAGSRAKKSGVAADEYRRCGFLAQAHPLADPSILPGLLADEPMFADSLRAMRAQGRQGVPYMLTNSIRRVAEDAAIIAMVEAILGTHEWVMWGANIRRATPNQAHAWHVDLESLLWSTTTVAIGLAGCTSESATWFIAGTHLRGKGPPSNEAAILAQGCPKQVAGFGNGGFYVFDARTWHRGDPVTSRDRIVLFMHYQRADEPRIPLMVDYVRQRWAREGSPYFTNVERERLRTDIAGLPWWYRFNRWKRRLPWH